jgi:DNA-binding NtrC family response regulator
MKILVVDDEKLKCKTLASDLAAVGHETATAGDGEAAWEMLQGRAFDVVVTDLKMPQLDGMELLKRIKAAGTITVDVVLMSAYGSIPVAVEAMKQGAFDFITKPFRNEEILPLIDRIEKKLATPSAEKGAAVQSDVAATIIGESPGMKQVKQMIGVAVRTDANVLLCGETGVGKDRIAAAIHRNSHRSKGRFTKVGCTLFSPNLIESELYGHERGSFTGADKSRKGRFDVAEGGTLYLDDVDDIPLEQQAKLLRAIEEKVFERVGGTDLIKADVRVVASTKRDLRECIKEATFRQDLYYRLDVLRINIPSLRERREDIPLLVKHLMLRVAKDNVYQLDEAAMEVLKRHHWPGNVRELYHTLERAYLIGDGRISAEILSSEATGILSADSGETPEFNLRGLPAGGFHAAMEHAERQLLMNALEASGGNKTAAATALGMKPSTFRDRLAKYGLG